MNFDRIPLKINDRTTNSKFPQKKIIQTPKSKSNAVIGKMKVLVVTSESLIWHLTTESDLLLLEDASEVVFPPPPILFRLSSPRPEFLLETDLPLLNDEAGVDSDSELLDSTRPRFADSKNSIARSSRLISGKPEPLTVLTNFPLGAVRSESLSREERGRAGRLRLRERRW